MVWVCSHMPIHNSWWCSNTLYMYCCGCARHKIYLKLNQNLWSNKSCAVDDGLLDLSSFYYHHFCLTRSLESCDITCYSKHAFFEAYDSTSMVLTTTIHSDHGHFNIFNFHEPFLEKIWSFLNSHFCLCTKYYIGRILYAGSMTTKAVYHAYHYNNLLLLLMYIMSITIIFYNFHKLHI